MASNPERPSFSAGSGGSRRLLLPISGSGNVSHPLMTEESEHTTSPPAPRVSSTSARRSIDGTRLLRDNISSYIREFQPFMDSARGNGTINFSTLLNRSQSADASSSSQNNRTTDSIVINLEEPSTIGQESTSANSNVSHAHFQAATMLNRTSQPTTPSDNPSNASNNDGPTAETLRNVLEAQQALSIFQKYIPFALILITKAVYDHCEGIFHLIVLLVAFVHGNAAVRREATKQGRKSYSKLFFALVYVVVCLMFISYIFQDEKLYLSLMLNPPYQKPLTVWDLLWLVLVIDFIVKLITIIFKILMTMLPARVLRYQKRGKVYLFIEATSQLYRSFAPIQPWVYFLLESYQGAEKIVGVFLSAAYMVSKGGSLLSRLKLFKNSALKLLQNVTLGSAPSKDQIQTAGNQCPICHDEYDSPVLLECRHIFCESCVSTWFDREQTCPLCRAKIVDDPSWRDGSTTFYIQLF